MQVFNSFQALAAGMGQDIPNVVGNSTGNCTESGTTSNAQFKMPQSNVQFTPEQQSQIKGFMQAVFDAEKRFRAADNAFMQKQSEINKQLQTITAQRLEAARKFENAKNALGKPLTDLNIGIVWEEPQVDKTSLDVTV